MRLLPRPFAEGHRWNILESKLLEHAGDLVRLKENALERAFVLGDPEQEALLFDRVADGLTTLDAATQRSWSAPFPSVPDGHVRLFGFFPPPKNTPPPDGWHPIGANPTVALTRDPMIAMAQRGFSNRDGNVLQYSDVPQAVYEQLKPYESEHNGAIGTWVDVDPQHIPPLQTVEGSFEATINDGWTIGAVAPLHMRIPGWNFTLPKTAPPSYGACTIRVWYAIEHGNTTRTPVPDRILPLAPSLEDTRGNTVTENARNYFQLDVECPEGWVTDRQTIIRSEAIAEINARTRGAVQPQLDTADTNTVVPPPPDTREVPPRPTVTRVRERRPRASATHLAPRIG